VKWDGACVCVGWDGIRVRKEMCEKGSDGSKDGDMRRQCTHGVEVEEHNI
jgi:hypothetical protein